MSEGEEGKSKKKTARAQKGKERADSLSILDYLVVEDKEKEKENSKRKREGEERPEEDLNKKNNKIDRTPPGLKKMEGESTLEMDPERQKGDDTMIGMQRELKKEMVGMRNEMKIINNNWETRMERIEKKVDEMKGKMKELEKQRQETGILGREGIGKITERVLERIKETKGKEETGEKSTKAVEDIGQEVRRLKRIMEGKEKERKNRIVIRGLNTNARLSNTKEAARIRNKRKDEERASDRNGGKRGGDN